VAKKIKVPLTNNRYEIIELNSPISAEDWWAGTQRDGSSNVLLNVTTYPKEEIVGVEEVKSRVGRTNMDGV
jgi:hypothetical protein